MVSSPVITMGGGSLRDGRALVAAIVERGVVTSPPRGGVKAKELFPRRTVDRRMKWS